MASVTLSGLKKNFGGVTVIHGLDLAIADGAFVALVGPSGCGKSTLLRMIAGLEEVSEGEIAFDGTPVDHLSPRDRNIAMVFQSYALYPHMTVAQNMAFNLKIAGVPAAEREQRVAEAARLLEITDLLQRRPAQLSGGQRQRVAMGRAVVRDPAVFLFDEPLSNLDAKLRVQMRTEIKGLHAKIKRTSIYVTHDQVEAMTLADTVVVLNKGRIEQAGAPMDLYRTPANLFVAGFIGSPAMNFVSAEIISGAGGPEARLPNGDTLKLDPAAAVSPGDQVTLGLRPENFVPGNGDNPLHGTIRLVERTGAQTHLVVDMAGGDLTAIIDGGIDVAPGMAFTASVAPALIHVFDPATGARR
ncbi:MAG TPA: sn-glycerol-3-phosphate ABC transporter ATP-binding protein UgpC [Devosia sp.]|nr:sn-glycerol-3-phosphate ABC transporter ATP-binding protein UgpC [Devosia sp.]